MNIITLINTAKIFERFAQAKVSPRLAYKIMKFCKSAGVEEEFYNTKRNEIIDMYAIKDENGQVVVSDDGMINIVPDKIAEANAAMQELNGLEVEAPSIRFTLDELEGLELSVADMFALDVFIEE
jgi:hypothetical protein